MYNFDSVNLTNPGSDTLSLTMQIGDEYFNSNPVTDSSWDKKAARFLNNGIPRNPTALESVEIDSNQPIEHTYSVYPWKDNTHNQIQPYQLVFITKYLDPEYQMVNMAPIYWLNIQMQDQYNKFYRNFGQVDPNKDFFKQSLEKFGETGLDIYRMHPFINVLKNDELKKFVDLAYTDNFLYLTKQGILSKWNFSGAVISKQQSTAPNDYLDFPQSVESVNVVGVVIGQEARVYNIWGPVQAGHKLFLVLTRKKLSNNKYGAFQWISWFSKGKYPNFFYEDDSGRKQRAFVQYVGLCTRNIEGEPTERQIQGALGGYNVMEDAYETTGTLPCITVQIGI